MNYNTRTLCVLQIVRMLEEMYKYIMRLLRVQYEGISAFDFGYRVAIILCMNA